MTSSELYSVRLDQDKAKQLVRDGGTLLCLGVPQGTVIGIDHQTHLAGPKFKGIKMLPPGTHLLAYNSVSSQGDFSATTSFFFNVKPCQVTIRKWDPATELMKNVSDDEAERFAEGVRRFEFDDSLAPYNLNAYPTWQRLSSFIDPGVIDRLSPVNNGNLCVLAEAGPSGNATDQDAEGKLAQQLAASSMAEKGEEGCEASTSLTGRQKESDFIGRCHYTQIPKNFKSKALSPSELTQANMDKSALLEEVLSGMYGGKPDRLLGELQFAFLAFIVGQSLESFGQWKALLHLLFSCEQAPVHKRTKFYTQVLAAVEAQLEYSLGEKPDPESPRVAPFGVPMVDELLEDSFLKHLFSHFFSCLETSDVPLDLNLKTASDSLQILLKDCLGWNFRFSELDGGESDDEYAPVVVDL